MTTRHESTAAYVARLEREIEQKRREAAEYAAMAQPLLAEHEARQAAIAAEAAAAEQRNREHAARIAEIEAGVAEAKRQVEGERIAKIRDAVEASDAVKTLAARAKADFDKYGATGMDVRNSDVCLEAARLFEQLLGIGGTYGIWRLMEPTYSAEMHLFGLRWSAFFTPAEGGELRVDCGSHGPQAVPNLAELWRWASEQPNLFAQLFPAP